MSHHQTQAESVGSIGKRAVVTSVRVMASMALIAIGVLSLIFPVATGVSAASIVPVLLILGGLVGIFDGLFGFVRPEDGVDWAVGVFGFVYFAVGLVLASNLSGAIFAMSVLVAAGFIAQTLVGVFVLLAGRGHRLWLLFLTVCNALLALISFVQWPLGAMQLVGISVGISFLSWGLTLLFGGFSAKTV